MASNVDKASLEKSVGTESVPPGETAARVVEYASKSADEAAANAKTASEAARPELLARAAAARQLAEELRKSAGEATTHAKTSASPIAVTTRKPVTAPRDVKQLAAEIEAMRQKLATAEAALKSATESKGQANSVAAAAIERSKQLAVASKSADARVAQARQAAAPRNLIDFATSTSFLLTVKAAPIEVSATTPRGGELRRGARLDVKVNVRRARGFKGPVTLTLPLPPGATGIKAEAVTIPAGKTDSVFTIAADKSAPAGPIANLVVRGSAEFDGQAEVDAPISIKVVP